MPERRGTPPPEIPDIKKIRLKHDEYETIEPFVVVEDKAYRERLDHLRGLSNELNKTLQWELEEADLPYYSWNKGGKSANVKNAGGMQYPKVLRFAVLLRPEFYSSSEEKNKQTRYTTADDQVTAFIHLRADGSVQETRYHVRAHMLDPIRAFGESLVPRKGGLGFIVWKEKVEEYIRVGDMKSLSRTIMERLNSNGDSEDERFVRKLWIDFPKQSYAISSVGEAKQYFTQDYAKLFFRSPRIIRNLSKIVLMSVLESMVKNIKEPRPLDQVKSELTDVAKELFAVQVPCLLGSERNTIGLNIPDAEQYAHQTIKKLVQVYKPRILGWEK
ncbi:MAG: hypothetical protein Q7S48_02360 [bacterium]|nr:hypothetical protein [bacterium]